MYASLARRLYESNDVHEALRIIKELKKKLRDRIPSLEEVKALFPEIIFTDNITKQRGLVRYILARFDGQLSSAVPVDYEAMTIEHLASQSLIGTSGFTEDIVGQVGNLILVSGDLNQKLRNKMFSEKKQILQAANFPLPRDIAAASDWSPQNIISRTESMAVESYNELWKI